MSKNAHLQLALLNVINMAATLLNISPTKEGEKRFLSLALEVFYFSRQQLPPTPSCYNACSSRSQLQAFAHFMPPFFIEKLTKFIWLVLF